VPYGLYRTSVPVQRCNLPLPIPLLSYVHYGMYRTSVPLQRCTLTLPMPLFPLCAVRLVQNLSDCTAVHFNFTNTSTPPMCRTACTEHQCLYNGALYLYLYLYSPYVSYGLYRASVPVQRCTLPLPIPLLPYVPYGLYRTSVPLQRCALTLPMPLFPLCAVRLVQNLSDCTTVHFNFTNTSTPPMCRTACTEHQCLYNGALYLYLYLKSPYVPYGLYTASVPVQRCTLPLPRPLLPLCAVGPVQSLSTCTTVHSTFTYTSTPPMCRTACTEPQYLYNGALYLYLYLYSSYVPYGLYRTSVPVQRCTLPLPLPLLPLCAVGPVQSLSTCTTMHFTFTYTSTPPMCRTACTEHQCLYNGEL